MLLKCSQRLCLILIPFAGREEIVIDGLLSFRCELMLRWNVTVVVRATAATVATAGRNNWTLAFGGHLTIPSDLMEKMRNFTTNLVVGKQIACLHKKLVHKNRYLHSNFDETLIITLELKKVWNWRLNITLLRKTFAS